MQSSGKGHQRVLLWRPEELVDDADELPRICDQQHRPLPGALPALVGFLDDGEDRLGIRRIHVDGVIRDSEVQDLLPRNDVPRHRLLLVLTDVLVVLRPVRWLDPVA